MAARSPVPSGGAPPGWRRSSVRRLSSVRARATLVSVFVVGAAMAGGALALLAVLRGSMTEGVETTARAQLSNVASLLKLGQLPAQLPAGRGGTFTQVVDARGQVVASSASLLASVPMSRLNPGEEGVTIQRVPSLTAGGERTESTHEGPFLLLAQRFTVPAGTAGTGPDIVYVAATLHPAVEAANTVGLSLATGLPVLVVLVAALVWTFAGRALRPVEAIRAEVADISGHDLHRRVPEPGTKDEVAQLARTMNEMLDRLEASAEAQKRFVADASHELRSPLAVLHAGLEVAVAHPAEFSWPAVAAEALEEARRLQRVIDDLLVLATVDEKGAGGHQQEVDLDELVLEEARRRRPTATVQIDLRRVSGGRVWGAPDQLARVVQNLMDNALRHARDRIAVEVTAGQGTVLLAVEDDGPGVPASARARIFERFARLDEARSQEAGGTGLGLAITRGIVVAHGGTIAVVDGSAGARFEVRLPASEPALDSPAGPGPAPVRHSG